MDKNRAQAIASSPVMANVTYNGAQIYIENVNENKDTANVHPLNQPGRSEEVPVTSLIEQ